MSLKYSLCPEHVLVSVEKNKRTIDDSFIKTDTSLDVDFEKCYLRFC